MIKRRKFLQASVIAGGAGLSLSSLATADGSSQRVWDGEYDIICAGSGAAACSAAVTAVDQGATVLLLEKSGIFGGTTRRSGGVAWIPNNFALRAAGVDDLEQDCLKYMARYSFPERYSENSPLLGMSELEYRRLQAFYRSASLAVDRFREIGVTRFIAFELSGGVGPSPDYAPLLWENKTPKGRSVWPDPGVSGGRGAAMIDGMIDWIRERGADLRLRHAVDDILVEEGRVVGVRCIAGDQKLQFHARKGVILGTGGFAHAPDLVQRYLRFAYGSCATPGATGDLLPVLQGMNTRMGDLSTAWRSQVVFEEALRNSVVPAAVNVPPGDSMILVNREGHRVVNEKKNYNDRTRIHYQWDSLRAEYPNRLLFMVFDQRTLDLYSGKYPLPEYLEDVDYIVQGNDAEELASAIAARLTELERTGAPSFELSSGFASELESSIQRFSRMAETGLDLDFERGSDPAETDWLAYFSTPRPGTDESQLGVNRTMYPFTPGATLYAIIMAPGILDTNSGPEINEHAQVLAADGTPIPGLYGAGNCVASPTREAYYGAGGTIGPAIAFGYLAAMHAATRSDSRVTQSRSAEEA